MPQLPTTRPVRIWDLPTRLFHWGLVALVAFAWVSAELGGSLMDWHMRAGYAVLALVLFRLIWGVIGSRTARFASFVRGPGAVLAYLRTMLRPDAPHHLGHNPAGGAMILVLLAVLALQGGTGLFATDDILTEGPLVRHVSSATASLLTGIHEANFTLLLALVALHVGAALFYLIIKHDNLIRPMITGRRAVPAAQVPADDGIAPLGRAVLAFAIAASAVAAVVLL